MMPLVLGVVLVSAAVGAFAFAMLGDSVPRISKQRRVALDAPLEPLGKVAYQGFVTGVDSALKRRGWAPFRGDQLEMADVKKPLGVVVTWLFVFSLAAFVLGTLLAESVASGLLFSLIVPVGAKVTLRIRAGRRRRLFGKQLDNTLRIISSVLRAGQSLPLALNSVALDSEPPMSEEIAQIINENRLGRDLVEGMKESAERMDNDDFKWFAEAVEIQRESGGNLTDIIDTVGETIRDRAEIRERIRANAAEGKASAYVLMGLPVGLAAVYSVMNPGYLNPLVQTPLGWALLTLSAILYGVSYVWMRAIIAIKV